MPKDLKNYPFKEYLDIYFPTKAFHPITRIRRRGNEYEITKKYAIVPGDASQQYEFTIKLTEEEFAELNQSIDGKRIQKLRYFYKYNDIPFEIDIFQANLSGLATADFEFASVEAKNDFKMPDFCLAEVTQEKALPGGRLAGKKYSDIEPILAKYGYQSL